MKQILVTIDPTLLAELDATVGARRSGRSAVLNQALAEYLERRRSAEIRERYQAAYGNGEGLGPEFTGWEHQGVRRRRIRKP